MGFRAREVDAPDSRRDRELQPAGTPDGRHVIFEMARDNAPGVTNLYRRAVDGTGIDERLTTSARAQRPNAISPDGTRAGARGTRCRRRVTTSCSSRWHGTPRVEPLLQTPFDERNAAISPDGRWMAYDSNESGQSQIYVRPFPNVADARYQISNGGGRTPAWAPDGHDLFFVNRTSIMAVTVQLTPTFSAGNPDEAVRRASASCLTAGLGPQQRIAPTTSRATDSVSDDQGKRRLERRQRVAGQHGRRAELVRGVEGQDGGREMTGARLTVTPERLREIERLFHEARERPPAERDAFLARACAHDSALRREVESLLAQPPAGMIDAPVGALVAGLVRPQPRLAPGRRRSVYRIAGTARRRRDGRGVSRARHEAGSRRRDQDPAGARSRTIPERLARFQREARRPRVAQSSAHRAPSTGSKMPTASTALVMELVEGDDLARSPRARAPMPARRGAADREADRRSARSGARAGHHPSRSEAGEHQGARRRHGEGARLRAGEGVRPGRRTGRRAVDDVADDHRCTRRRPA